MQGFTIEANYNTRDYVPFMFYGITIEATDNTRDYVPFMFYGVTFEIGIDDDINTFFMFNEI